MVEYNMAGAPTGETDKEQPSLLKKKEDGDSIINSIRNSQMMKGAKGLLGMKTGPDDSFFGQLAERMSTKQMAYYNTLADRASYGDFGDPSAALSKAGKAYKAVEAQDFINKSKGLATPTAILKAKTQIHNKLMGDATIGSRNVLNPLTGKREKYENMSRAARAAYVDLEFRGLRSGWGADRIQTLIAGDPLKDKKVQDQAAKWYELSGRNPGLKLLLRGAKFGKDTAYTIAGAYMEMWDFVSDPENKRMLEKLANETATEFEEGEVGGMILAFARERGEDIRSAFAYIDKNMSLDELKQHLINKYSKQSTREEIRNRERTIMEQSQGGDAYKRSGGLLDQDIQYPRSNQSMWPGQSVKPGF